jgi:hypothetical protein
MSKTKLVEELDRIATEAKAQAADPDKLHIDVQIYGESTSDGGGEVTLHFSNDDMERPEVADTIYMEVDA